MITKTAATPAICCFGEALGTIANSSASRLADGATGELGFAGAESNVAIALARLGHAVGYVSALGDDPFGWRILKTLRAEGVHTEGVEIVSGSPTALLLRDRPAWGEPSIYYYRNSSAFSARCAALAESFPLDSVRILFLTGITPALSEECRQGVARLLERASAYGTQVWFDINFRAKLWSAQEAGAFVRAHLQHVHGIFAGSEEAQLVFPESRFEDLANRYFDAGTSELVVKAAAAGASYHSRERALKQEAFPLRQEIDTIGAGDAFNAGFLSARCEGLHVHRQLERACALGALACLSRGDWEGSPTQPELERFLRQETASQR